MKNSKSGLYFPNHHTLALINTFGTRTPFSQTHSKKHTASQTTIPIFARTQTVAYDKENLLEQMRREKTKERSIQEANCNFRKALSKSRLRIERQEANHFRDQSQSKAYALRRQIQLLSQEVQKQNQQITELKSSKKYNRFIEFKVMRDIYLEQIAALKVKDRSYKYELRKNKAARLQQLARKRNIRRVNQVVTSQIQQHNITLVHAIEQTNAYIREGKLKHAQHLKQRERLLKDIHQLQLQTRTVYIQFANKDSPTNSKPPGSERLPHQCPPTVVQQDQHNDYDDSFESSGQSEYFSSSEEESRKEVSEEKLRIKHFSK